MSSKAMLLGVKNNKRKDNSKGKGVVEQEDRVNDKRMG